MGRITPDRPFILGPGEIVSYLPAQAAAKCGYCGLYGELGRCIGCGAPNTPVHEGLRDRAVRPLPPRFDLVTR
jgi:hypothetical protein